MGSHRKLLILLAATLALASCETTEPKHTAATPSARATAPSLAVTQSATSPAQAAKVQEKLVPKVDPVEQLLATVEREYQAGVINYNAGHLEAAKENFDHAFNVLLSSSLDIHSDDRLERELDRLVEGVHNIELAALKEGDGFTEQRSEPAPIDEANEVTFPVDPNIRAKAIEELKTTQSDLPLVLNDAVASYISYFSTGGGRHFLEHGWIRSGRYHDMISRILKEEGVPQDLIYLAQAESGFHPLALSRAGARGMWQFMSGTGSGYSLERNWWIDERQDPEKSTRAAAAHLKDLYNQFGDWYLAMAAYNSGAGTVQHAVQRTGYADYWELYKRGVLPSETRNYVPIILAITIMSKNPAQYGLDRIHTDRPLEYDTVKVDYPVDLRLVSECVDTSVAMLQDLNPSLTRLTTPKGQSFVLHLPLDTKQKYETAIVAIPKDKRVWWHYHKVVAGDTLASLAKKYRTTSRAIAEANSLDGEQIEGQQRLIIPVTPGKHGEAVAFSKHATRYTVRKGDTAETVADDFGVPVARLRSWNALKGNALKVGRVLSIHKPLATSEGPETATSSSRSRRKTVQSAENESDKLAPCTKWGRKNGKRVCLARAKTSEHSRSSKGTGAKMIHHTVRKGETLNSIASAYNTTVTALKRDNRSVAANLKPGRVLVIKSGD
jgi:membrane-bound lytic murein transglycosylase D